MKVPSLLIISLYLILLFNNGCAVIDNFKAEDIVLPANKTSQDIPVGLYKVTQSSFTYREADLGSQKLERIEPGSIVEVVDVAGAFAQIKFSENTTWLKKNQVEETNVPDVVRTLGRVRSKEGPSELAQEMVILESGRLLTVKSISGGWLLVKISENRGWLLSGVLEPLGITMETSTFEPTNRWVTLKRANLRSKPTINSRILKTLPPRTQLDFVGRENEWIKVDYRGTIGYMHEDLLSQ